MSEGTIPVAYIRDIKATLAWFFFDKPQILCVCAVFTCFKKVFNFSAILQKKKFRNKGLE